MIIYVQVLPLCFPDRSRGIADSWSSAVAYIIWGQLIIFDELIAIHLV